MPASLPVRVVLAGGADTDIVTGPCVLTDLIVTEASAAAPAVVNVAAAEDDVPYITVGVAPGQSVVWHGRLVMAWGINVAAQSGAVAVTVGYY